MLVWAPLVDASGTSLMVGAAIALLGAIAALRFLPARAEEVESEPMTEDLVLEAA